VTFKKAMNQEIWHETAHWFFGKETTAEQYWETFGFNPESYSTWWVEVGRDSALPGATQARKEIAPIFTLRKSHRGNFHVVRQAVEGFCSPDETLAWVATVTWEALLGEDTFERITANADRVQRRARQVASGRQRRRRAEATGGLLRR
jgi:hypothetical protein